MTRPAYTFPAVVMAALGLFGILAALSEWSDSGWLSVGRAFSLLGSDYAWWGAFDAVLGLVALVAAYLLWNGGPGGAFVACLWAVFAIVRWIWYIPAAPWLSIVVIALAVGVVWSVTRDEDALT